MDSEGARFNQTAVKQAYGAMLIPADFAKATILNNLYLRFPDLAPNFPFRDLKTQEGYLMLEKVRHHEKLGVPC